MSRIEELNQALADLQSSSADVQACAVVSEDGLIIASALSQGMEETHIGAMSAAMLSIGERAASELKRGDLQQVFIKGALGYIILISAGPHALLVALAGKDAKLGLIFFDLNRSSERIEKILI